MTIANTLQSRSNLAALITLGEYDLASEVAAVVQERIRKTRPCCRNCQQGKEVKGHAEKTSEETASKKTEAAAPP